MFSAMGISSFFLAKMGKIVQMEIFIEVWTTSDTTSDSFQLVQSCFVIYKEKHLE